MRALLRLFFHFLYHPFAFAYDFVAAAVSFGHWKEWILEVVPFIEGTRTLEIGHGPGHLHRFLLLRGLEAVAMDESASMGRLARRNLVSRDGKAPSEPQILHLAYAQTNLTRGIAQELPFRDGAFDTVIATFPAEYIYDPRTLSEAQRVLRDTGRFVILPGVMIIGRKVRERFLAWVYRITGQTPPNLPDILRERSREPFEKAGFHVDVHEVDVQSGVAYILVAAKFRPVSKAQTTVSSPGTAKEEK